MLFCFSSSISVSAGVDSSEKFSRRMNQNRLDGRDDLGDNVQDMMTYRCSSRNNCIIPLREILHTSKKEHATDKDSRQITVAIPHIAFACGCPRANSRKLISSSAYFLYRDAGILLSACSGETGAFSRHSSSSCPRCIPHSHPARHRHRPPNRKCRRYCPLAPQSPRPRSPSW